MSQSSKQLILMLEDNSERIKRFRNTVGAIEPDLHLLVWSDAHAMIREARSYLPAAKVISLDHDLEPSEAIREPGDGLQAVKFLVSQPIRCPVIVHTSNFERSLMMADEFEQAGWPFLRVAPIGDDWIEADWSRAVKEMFKLSVN
jgi:hypothetical protein